MDVSALCNILRGANGGSVQHLASLSRLGKDRYRSTVAPKSGSKGRKGTTVEIGNLVPHGLTIPGLLRRSVKVRHPRDVHKLAYSPLRTLYWRCENVESVSSTESSRESAPTCARPCDLGLSHIFSGGARDAQSVENEVTGFDRGIVQAFYFLMVRCIVSQR